jgi:ankyrin repeat protein
VEEAWRSIFLGAGKPELLNGLRSLFSDFEYDDWGFEELHKIILGILPLDLELQLQKPLVRAQVDLPDSHGRTPLHWASLRGDAYGVEKLLLAGANPNCQAPGKDTPLHCAAISQNPRVYELLIMAGAVAIFVNSWGDTALNCACNHRDIEACIKPLIISGAKRVLNHRNRGGDTPLSHAAGKNNRGIASLLLDLGADMLITNLAGETPLFVAIISGSHDIVGLLLKRGDNCINNTIHGSTVLHYIAQYGDVKTANMLSASPRLGGVDPDAVDFQGRTAMQVLKQRVVSQEEFEEAFKRLVERTREAKAMNLDLDSKGSERYYDALEW